MRYLVCVLFVLVLLSTVAFGGEFSGRFTSDLRFDLFGMSDITVADFDADVDIDYTLSTITLGAIATIDESQLEYLLFDAWGWLGAIWFTSYLQFGGPDEGDPLDFELFGTIAGLTVAGVDMYGAIAIDRRAWNEDDEIPRFGWTFGAAGMIGECRLMVEAAFDLSVHYESPHYEEEYWTWYVLASTMWPGWPGECTYYQYGEQFPFAIKLCDDWSAGPTFWADPRNLEPCAPSFNRLTTWLSVPIGCLDPQIVIEYTYDDVGDRGYFYASLWLFDIGLGIPFLELDTFQIYFTPAGKSVWWEWGLLVGDVFCIEPWFELDSLLGLSVEYEVNGITFKAGTLFDPHESFDRYGNRDYNTGYPWLYCSSRACEWMEAYDEFFALIIDGESCCGGGFGLSIFTWFDIDDDDPSGDAAGIFGWEETRIEGYLDIGTNTTLTGSLSFLNEGLNWIQVGVDFVFPSLRRLASVDIGTKPEARGDSRFSGLLTSDLRVNLLGVPDIDIADFDADLDIDYALADVTLGATTIIDHGELEYVLFDAWGTLGALWFTSYLQFGGPENGNPIDYEMFATIAGLSIGGVDTFGIFAIDRRIIDPPLDDESDDPRFGWAFGAAGAIGECRLMIEARFQLSILHTSLYTSEGSHVLGGRVLASTMWPGAEGTCHFYRYGDRFPFAIKFCDDWWVGPDMRVEEYILQPCVPCFSHIDLFIDVPLWCVDTLVWAYYSYNEYTDETFFRVQLELYDLGLGIPFLELDTLGIVLEPEFKEVSLEWELLVGDAVCIEPWFALAYGDTDLTFDGIQLRGLRLEYAHNGVTFKAGTLFDVPDDLDSYSFDRYGNRDPEAFPWSYCAARRCETMDGYDEYVGLIIDGETCCGGGFGLSIFTWFDIDDDGVPWDAGDPYWEAGIFGWEELRIEGYLDIGANLALTGSMSILNEGLNWIQFGVDVDF